MGPADSCWLEDPPVNPPGPQHPPPAPPASPARAKPASAAPAPATAAPAPANPPPAPVAAARAPVTLASPAPWIPPRFDALPAGSPDDAADPPGRAPAGATRSLRGADGEGAATFVAIYRDGVTVVIGAGRVGCRGRWQALHYPTIASASNAYARACAGYLADGYTDL